MAGLGDNAEPGAVPCRGDHRGRVPWIIIVNYRTADLTIDCLRSLSAQLAALPGCRVIVVDNRSDDGSVERLTAAIEREGWSAWASVAPNDRNGGFAYGNNAGIRLALSAPTPPDYLMLLNPDTIAHPEAIEACVSFLADHPDIGIVGSRLQDADGHFVASAHNAPSVLGELDAGARLGVLSRLLARHVVTPPQRPEAHECEWVSGASMMVRREVFDRIGVLDDGYFLYFEEVDFCCRARQAGWRVWYLPSSTVMHLEGAATGIRAVSRRARYWYDSRRRFFVKHYGVGGLLLADLLWACGRLSYLLRRRLRLGAQQELADPKWFMADLLIGDLRSILSGAAFGVARQRNKTIGA
jgi:GT2 family glycosyltransferase